MERLMLENESGWGMLMLFGIVGIVVLIAWIVWKITDPGNYDD